VQNNVTQLEALPMKPLEPELISTAERGKAAAKAMSRELSAWHQRWNMPLLTWKHGRDSDH